MHLKATFARFLKQIANVKELSFTTKEPFGLCLQISYF